MYDWDDLRCFLAVARGGSTLGASRELKVNQTTVARRIASFETALGFKLFDRVSVGCRLTPAGQAMLASAEQVEESARNFGLVAARQRRELNGLIKVTTTELLANIVLIPTLRGFTALHPDIRIHSIIDDRKLDLLRGEADVALRVGPAPEQNDLVVRKLVETNWGTYCHRSYAAQNGCPTSIGELVTHKVLGFEGALDYCPAALWMREHVPGPCISSRSNSLPSHVHAIRAGLGVGLLPRVEGDRHPDLVLGIPKINCVMHSLWLVMRPDVRDLDWVRTFVDFLVEQVLALRAAFEGDAPTSPGQPGALNRAADIAPVPAL